LLGPVRAAGAAAFWEPHGLVDALDGLREASLCPLRFEHRDGWKTALRIERPARGLACPYAKTATKPGRRQRF